MDFLSFDPHDIAHKDLHQFIVGMVAPRPIAFVSTIDENGIANLAPYSFFNAFSSNPPIVVFSSNRRATDNSTKDTLHNVKVTGECVINSVSYPIVRKMAVASVDFPSEVSEFDKTGLTPIPSDIVKPFRVKESPSSMECRVKEIITLGDQGGAGHLVVCEVVRIHVAKDVLMENNRIDPHKMDLMGRLGRAYYVRCSGDAIHTIVQEYKPVSIGYDQLPEHIKRSEVLTGNDLGRLAGRTSFPNDDLLASLREQADVKEALNQVQSGLALHVLAKQYIDRDEVETGFGILLLEALN